MNLDHATNPELLWMDIVKIQAQVLIPVLKAARAEFGKEHADRLIIGAIQEYRRGRLQRLGAQISGSPREKYEGVRAMEPQLQTNDVEIEPIKQEPGTREFNVTRCRFAELFQQLGEPELGAALLCDGDLYLAAVGSPEVELVRTQTLMEGADRCDFCYRYYSG